VSATLSPRESYTEEQKLAVEAQLERLLAAPFFSHSRRFPSFLRYVVEHTLAGDTENLKERTLGIEIFGKQANYDTASDPIVRVTAAEIRKRIAQYYQNPGHETELRLSLPPGSYIPTFQLHEPAPPPAPAPAPALLFTPVLPVTPVLPAAHMLQVAMPLAATPAPFKSPASEQPRKPTSRGWFAAAAVLLLCVTGVAAWMAGIHRARPSALAEFWAPILGSPDPVLFCVGDQTQYTSLSLHDANDPRKQVTLPDNLTAVIIDDLSVTIKIAGVLQTSGKRFRLRGQGATTLSDLRNGPSVLIGAFSNEWTLRLLKPLRFHFNNNPQMTTFSIVDSAAAGRARWAVDRPQQIATNNYRDYAIVARFTDATTGKPTLIAAGIGRGGTIAAGEFLTNPDAVEALRAQGHAPGARNVEIVLSTQIIDGEPGTPTIEAVHTW